MSRITFDLAKVFASKFRAKVQLSLSAPINLNPVLLSEGILTVLRPLADNLCGLSVMTADKSRRYILANSKHSIGRLRFTIAHELYHLYYDDNPEPHMCMLNGKKDAREQSADMFASALLMPIEGILANIPEHELRDVSLGTIMRLEQIFMVSHQAMCIRLKRLRLINEKRLQELLQISVARTAQDFGYNTYIYDDGDGRKDAYGDFVAKAKRLFDEEKISEGHYLELVNLIKDGES